MVIKRRHILVIIGLILIIHTFNTIYQVTTLFSETEMSEGYSIMEYSVIGQLDLDKLQNLITDETGMALKDIVVNIEDKRLRIEMKYLDFVQLKELDQTINNYFNASIKNISINTFSPFDTSTLSRFKHLNWDLKVKFIGYIVIFIIGIILLVLGVYKILQNRKAHSALHTTK